MTNPASTPRPSEQELTAWNGRFETLSPHEILADVIERFFPRLVLACSFGAEDVVLLDMIHRLNPAVPLLYLDTEFLFPETYETRDRLIAHYRLPAEQVIRMQSTLTPGEQAAEYGEALWTREPDRCCALRKIEPLTRALSGYAAWVTGIRRDQSPIRATAGLIEWDHKFQLVKINPLAKWTWTDVWTYIKLHEVPYNPLHDQHYPSIGCTHCTIPVRPGEDPRSGRWNNFSKTECGLHT